MKLKDVTAGECFIYALIYLVFAVVFGYFAISAQEQSESLIPALIYASVALASVVSAGNLLTLLWLI